ncbi:MAG: chromosome partitioning protein, partial [Halieaceae bacterium]
LCRVGNSDVELQEAQDYIGQTRYHLLNGYMPERTGYRRASDGGRSATETSYPALNVRTDELIQSIINRVEELS